MTSLSLDPGAIEWVRPNLLGVARSPLLVGMHGFAGTERELAWLVPLLPDRSTVALLRGPIDGPLGSAGWFPPGDPGSPTADEVDAAYGAVGGWLDETLRQAGPRPVIPFGFSQGGAMALELLRRHRATTAAGMVAGFTAPVLRSRDAHARVARPPVYATWDPSDDIVAPEAFDRTHRWLDRHATARVVLRPGLGHAVDARAARELAAFVAGAVLPSQPA